ncbi:hypothetical protein NX059_003623 [Plenodomus lindquistii]|nr:hypothetical protein NX059_003623 [Plenodomus lindquistii]
MVSATFYVMAILGLSLSFLASTCALCYILGVFPLLRELSNKEKLRRAEKAKIRPEEIELESTPDIQRRARERRRLEENKRRQRNKMRREAGFYEELGAAYRRS